MFGNVAQISFNAQPTGTGVATNENSDGKGKVNARAPATTRNGYPIGEFTFKGTVDCYVQDGTVAWFSGVIDKGGFGVTFPVVGPPAPGQYTHFLVAVKDMRTASRAMAGRTWSERGSSFRVQNRGPPGLSGVTLTRIAPTQISASPPFKSTGRCSRGTSRCTQRTASNR